MSLNYINSRVGALQLALQIFLQISNVILSSRDPLVLFVTSIVLLFIMNESSYLLSLPNMHIKGNHI